MTYHPPCHTVANQQGAIPMFWWSLVSDIFIYSGWWGNFQQIWDINLYYKIYGTCLNTNICYSVLSLTYFWVSTFCLSDAETKITAQQQFWPRVTRSLFCTTWRRRKENSLSLMLEAVHCTVTEKRRMFFQHHCHLFSHADWTLEMFSKTKLWTSL